MAAELLLTPLLLTGGMLISWANYQADKHNDHIATSLLSSHNVDADPAADNAGAVLADLPQAIPEQNVDAKIEEHATGKELYNMTPQEMAQTAMMVLEDIPPFDYHNAKRVIKIERKYDDPNAGAKVDDENSEEDGGDAASVKSISSTRSKSSTRSARSTQSAQSTQSRISSTEVVSPTVLTPNNSATLPSSATARKTKSVSATASASARGKGVAKRMASSPTISAKIMSASLDRPDIIIRPMVDMARELKDICTSFVNNVVMSDDNKFFNFLKLVIESMEAMITEYAAKHKLDPNKIIFMYKGGNIFRIINTTFLSYLPSPARKILYDAYNSSFGRSDADFELLVFKDLPDYEIHFEELSRLTFIVVCQIRDIIKTTPTNYLQYSTYSTSYQQELLTTKSFIDAFVNARVFSDPENTSFFGKSFMGVSFDGVGVAVDTATGEVDANALKANMNSGLPPYIGRRDFVIQRSQEVDPTKVDCTITFPAGDRFETIYCYSNNSINWKTLTNSLVEFRLVRAKFNFNVYANERLHMIGGELIDVSIPTKTDYKARRLMEMDRSDVIRRYELSNESTGERFGFYSYTVHELATDLAQILFLESPPWMIQKFTKRVKRLMFLLLLDCIAIRRYRLVEMVTIYADISNVFKRCSDNPDSSNILRLIKEKVAKYNEDGRVLSLLFEMLVHTFGASEAQTYPADKVIQFFGYLQEECGVAANVLTVLREYSTDNIFTTSSAVYAAQM